MSLGGTAGQCGPITHYAAEIEKLLGDPVAPSLIATAPDVEDPAAFALEKNLEDFLVQNWAQTDLGKEYDIFSEDGELVGQQYPTETGSMDILAIKIDFYRYQISFKLLKG